MSDLMPTEGGDVADLDVADITRDDEMVEALSLGLPVVADTSVDFELAELLVGWRTTVHRAPAPEPITVDDVETAIAARSTKTSRRAVRHLRLVAGAAAVIGVALGGLTMLSKGATPEDPLWAIKKVVYSSQAVQTQASYDARNNLEEAEKLLAAGKPEQAQQYLHRAQANMAPVQNKEARAQMDEWIGRLATSVEASIKAATPPAPPKKTAAKPKPPAPTVTDEMPTYTQQAPPQQTQPPQQQAPPQQQQRPEPTQPQQRPGNPGWRPPRPPITILPN
ncbi:hypothetical protein GOARA_028_00140 [Gordonia araii NBRC 100433]|uniref:Anti-sigma-D factor RsdA sigma factor binding region domain-containing protein n=1 Tax=Gordonia araii NBRC 100433 TaxID=1073574 RepID=G7GZS8_9ACTN|nr:anti-sigma-D factor RsdA [Gordonia araii]NNG98782.1 hypothetical protein [Gordonia araii NBRC 100433]GAB09103.1 hypothetical protein GOARA_028_00140 [Gordonia araii NBRC 100433]